MVTELCLCPRSRHKSRRRLGCPPPGRARPDLSATPPDLPSPAVTGMGHALLGPEPGSPASSGNGPFSRPFSALMASDPRQPARKLCRARCLPRNVSRFKGTTERRLVRQIQRLPRSYAKFVTDTGSLSAASTARETRDALRATVAKLRAQPSCPARSLLFFNYSVR